MYLATPIRRLLEEDSLSILLKRMVLNIMDDLNQSIGKRISLLRKSHGMTQERLAEELDVTIKHISAVERGVSSLSLEKMVEVKQILDCTLDYLITGKDYGCLLTKLPASILDILNSNNDEEISLLLMDLNLYSKLRRK